MQRKHWSALAGAAAIVTVVAGTAMAQGPRMDDRGWGTWDDGRGMWWGRPWRHGPEAMLDRVEGRLAFIKAELKITEPQAAAWNELAEAVRTSAKQHNERMKALFTGKTKTDTLLERLDAQEQFLGVRLDEIKQIKGGLNKLYAVLSDDQKKEADNIILPMVGMGMGPR
jgi:hypothetical protein